MSKEKTISIPAEIRVAWDEARYCAELIRNQQARIVCRTMTDGTKVRYTKKFSKSRRERRTAYDKE